MPRLIDADALLSVLKADLAQSISIDTATEDLFLTRIEEALTVIDTEIERMRNGLDRAEVENACLDALNAIANIRIADLCKQRDKARHDRDRYKRRIEAVQGENAELRAKLGWWRNLSIEAMDALNGQVGYDDSERTKAFADAYRMVGAILMRNPDGFEAERSVNR